MNFKRFEDLIYKGWVSIFIIPLLLLDVIIKILSFIGGYVFVIVFSPFAIIGYIVEKYFEKKGL